MKALQAHYDGKSILLDVSCKLKPNTKLLVLVPDDMENDSDNEWYKFSVQNLARAYSADEPEYSLSMLKEPNAEYESK